MTALGHVGLPGDAGIRPRKLIRRGVFTGLNRWLGARYAATQVG